MTAMETMKKIDDRIAQLEKALDRQCDNMAFVLNRVDLHGWHQKFDNELRIDRRVLKSPDVRRALVWDQADMHSDLSKEPKPNVRKSTWRVKANKCEVIGNIHEDMQLLYVQGNKDNE